jgi:PTH2 family peptidyl-tRNA hydrolase
MAPKGTSASAEFKMVIVVRGELRLTAGKAAVQVAHAAVLLALETEKRRPDALRAWSSAGQKKIALTVPSLAELEDLARRARAAGIPWVLVEDAGFTEVPPGTKTCLGLGPAPAGEIDSLTGGLALL